MSREPSPVQRVVVRTEQEPLTPVPPLPEGAVELRLIRAKAWQPPVVVRGAGLPSAVPVRLDDAEALAPELAAALGAWHVPVVAAALDQVSALALWHAVRDLEHVLAVNTLEAAERVADLLARGRTVRSVIAVEEFSPRRVLTVPGTTDPGDRVAVTVEATPEASPPDWLTIEPRKVTVRVQERAEALRWAVDSEPASAPAAPDDERRLLIGPANFAGQGREWARAVNTYGAGVTAESISVHNVGRIVFGSDLPLSATEWRDPRTRAHIARDFVAPATHVLVEAARPLLAVDSLDASAAVADVRSGRRDVDALLAAGKRVGLLFHGSEVRSPQLHAALEPWSPFRDAANRSFTEVLGDRTELIRRSFFGDDASVRFVSTLDLIDYVPDARWLPIVVPEYFFGAAAGPLFRSGRPAVAHAPTSNVLKGSAWIDPVLEKLDDEGVIRYRRVQDAPPASIPGLLRQVDVLVDQVVLGNPGVLAAQALAAGRLVLAHIPEGVRRRFPTPPPIVEVNPATLEETMRIIAGDPETFSAHAAEGVAFARTFHDGRYAARVLMENLLS